MATPYLTLDEIRPTVDLAGCWSMTTDQQHEYRVPSHHLILIESGRVEAKTPSQQFNARAGDLICFRPTERNQYGTRGPTVFYQLHLEFAPSPRQRHVPWLDEIGPLPVHIPLGDSFKPMRQVFETFCIELDQEGPVHRLRIRAAIYQMLSLITEVCTAKPHRKEALDEWQRARLRLGAEMASDIRIDQLARGMGIGVDHFIRQFKHRFGVTPKSYRTHARIREAARLLRGGGSSIKAVAYRLGFADPKSFTRTFKRHLGVAPSNLRLAKISAEKSAFKPALYAVNRHILPLDVGPNWTERYALRHRRS